MHSRERVAAALELAGHGANATTVARRLGLPRSTVRDWIAGRVPRPASAESERLCSACGSEPHRLRELPREYAYLLGLYLGDGCISSGRRGVFRLRITLDLRYPGIVDECASAVARIMPASKVGRYPRHGPDPSRPPSHVEVYSYSRSWPCLFPQHGAGAKHLRPIHLTGWQQGRVASHPEALLRGLIHSDGCRTINTGTNWRHPRYLFTNLSADIRGIFVDACELLDLHCTHAPNTVYVSRKADVAKLDAFIGPKS